MKLVQLLVSCLGLSLVSAQCFNRTYTFNNGISADWDLQTTQARQNIIGGDWAMHSAGNGATGWSRMRFVPKIFNTNSGAYTRIKIQMRGAPDGGKNSKAYLIQARGSIATLDAAIQDGTKDEIDFVEYYGGRNQATVNVSKIGKQVGGYPQILNVYNAGSNFNYYELILKNAYMSVSVYNSVGSTIDRRVLTGASVPTNPMQLFIGISDCSGKSWCPGSYTSDSWMAVRSVLIEACG